MAQPDQFHEIGKGASITCRVAARIGVEAGILDKIQSIDNSAGKLSGLQNVHFGFGGRTVTIQRLQGYIRGEWADVHPLEDHP